MLSLMPLLPLPSAAAICLGRLLLLARLPVSTPCSSISGLLGGLLLELFELGLGEGLGAALLVLLLAPAFVLSVLEPGLVASLLAAAGASELLGGLLVLVLAAPLLLLLLVLPLLLSPRLPKGLYGRFQKKGLKRPTTADSLSSR